MKDSPGTNNKAPGTKHEAQSTKHKNLRFLFLNQFVPPDPAPTAKLLGDVAEELRLRGHEIVLIGDGADYRGSKTVLGSRVLREAISLVRLFFKVIFVKRVNAIICLTSPPLVPVVARFARWRHGKAKLIHWAMDLYPEVAVALGEVREGSFLHRLTRSLMGGTYRACDRIIVLDEDMAACVEKHGATCEVLAPWPPALESSPREFQHEDSPFTWLYSGNLGRAHEWQTLLAAQRLLEDAGLAINLVFQGGGTEHGPAREQANALGLKRCHWHPYAAAEDLVPTLLAADCLIATQRPETSGALWPSKLALALELDRPIIWVGETGGAVGRRLKEKGHFCFVPGEAVELATAVGSLAQSAARPVGIPSPDLISARIKTVRATSISKMADWLETGVSTLKRKAV